MTPHCPSPLQCGAVNPVIDQGTRIDQNFSIESSGSASGVVDSLLEPVTTSSCLIALGGGIVGILMLPVSSLCLDGNCSLVDQNTSLAC